ncbi:heterogeneous nuclear ribonucleoprotein 1-like isoform X2 [Phalaenopsis equestris]|nr:heterogeneous nuclear ribonucleoprotein 1-like isoform X2 [Phalaenopsis equestris]
MESDSGKLFIGGISRDTNEVRLREYFESFGEVLEAIIMKDRITGRARGFGFVVFADPSVAEKIVMEKHLIIDGRMVEAKKAVPRDDHCILNRNSNSIHGSAPGQMKKIFVGGLASTVTNSDFRRYFEQFGTINDVVVMYDHNTQRPRGFGFITFESEEAVIKVLQKSLHELNGKMVEVKIAIPKELSPGPAMRLPIGGLKYGGLNIMNSILNGYNQDYNPNFLRMDGRFEQLTGVRKGFSPFIQRWSLEPGMSPTYSRNSSFNSGLGYGRALSPFFSENSSSIENPGSSFSSAARCLLGNIGLGYGTDSRDLNSFMSSGIGGLGGFGNNGLNWADSSSPPSANGISSLGFIGNPNYENAEIGFGLATGSYGRNIGISSANDSFATTANGYQGNYSDGVGGSIYGESTWLSASSDLDHFSPLGYGPRTASPDFSARVGSPVYMGGYIDSNRRMSRGGAI